MLLTNKKVAIIGGGPVGLTMARLLQQQGIAVTVYERDSDAQTRISGGTLDLHKGSGQDALAAADLLDGYYKLAKSMGRTVADDQGRVLFIKNVLPKAQHDAPEINRNDLRRLLLDSLAQNTVVWDRKFTGLEPQNGQWVLHFENGPVAMADLVIGANGGVSKVRAYITEAAIEYTGTIILQGEVAQPETACPELYRLCADNILMIAGNSTLLVASPDNRGLLSYSVMLRKPAALWPEKGINTSDTDSIITFLLDRLSGWGACYKQLIRATTSFIVWPTRKIPLDKPWSNSRPLPITLIGDAAHIMPPFAGQGVNTGLLDALILAKNLTDGAFTSIDEAIFDYERRMMAYATTAQLETGRNELMMFQPEFSFEKIYR